MTFDWIKYAYEPSFPISLALSTHTYAFMPIDSTLG